MRTGDRCGTGRRSRGCWRKCPERRGAAADPARSRKLTSGILRRQMDQSLWIVLKAPWERLRMESFAYLYILLSLLSHYPPDLVDFIDPADYFQAHEVQVTPEKMQELVLAQPRDEAAQVAQLLALRWLADHPTAETKTVLAQVAERKPAGEMDRFAAEYARRALDKIAGKPFTAAPRTSLRDGLRWFPRDVTDGGGLDLTVSWANKPFAPKILQQFTGQSSLLSFLIDKQKLYD